MVQDTQSLPPPVNDCLKLLKSATDHQRLAGLDLTQFSKANNLSSLHTLPPHFLHQLIRSATALTSFRRVPEIAAANDIISKIPLLPTILLASHIQILPELVAIKLVQGLLGKVVFLDVYVAELAVIVATLARHFALLHNAAKFDALHLLSSILSVSNVKGS
ncbi:hypothetical protein ACLB2K_059136 [Fragaria x ananassa]